MPRSDRSLPASAAGLRPRFLAGSLIVHTTLIGAGVLWGVLAPGRPEREAPAVAVVLAPAVTTSFGTGVPERLEPLPDPPLAEPELAESEVWAAPELPGDPRDEPQEPEPLRAVDWIAERPLELDLTGSNWPGSKGNVPAAEVAEPRPLAPPPAVASSEPAAAVVAEPIARVTPPPSYPRLARRAGEEGSVLCRLHLDDQGQVTRVELVESSGSERLDRAALDTLATWSFEPRREDGRPIPSRVLHRVTFRLDPARG